MEEMDFPSIKKIANNNADTKNNSIVCTICNIFTGKNKASLSAHMKACLKQKNGGAISNE